MGQGGLDNYFEHYLKRKPLFSNKTALQSNYLPESVNHRDEQIQSVADILAPALRQERPSNLFIYGKTGTGKTLTIRYVISMMEKVAKQNNIPLTLCYVNCKLKRVADTEYRLVATLARDLGENIPTTGLPTDAVYKSFFNTINKQKQLFIILLDEIDQLAKRVGDEILYNFTRINEELTNSQVSLVGISNDLTFADNLDPRVKSSLSEEELVFPPYNAFQIQDIIKQRCDAAFTSNIILDGVIQKCAAIAAREHGDARRALELIRVAGELAERENVTEVTLTHLDKAEEKIERDRVFDIITTQPKQFKVALYALLDVSTKRSEDVYTGEIYDLYKQLCSEVGLKPLTQRRISDIIAELDMLGIISANVISKGRYGRTRSIRVSIPTTTLPKVIETLKTSLDL